MKICVFMGSPRKNGNTAALLSLFLNELEKKGHGCQPVNLYEQKLLPCIACRTCQQDWQTFGCPLPDDMSRLFEQVLESDLLLLATPIYSWYCTPPMKIVLDRLVYGMNKYYGPKKGPALWAGKQVALLVTCGYRPEKGADLWEEGVKRYCKHSGLIYRGMQAERHLGYDTLFMDKDKEMRVRAFAKRIMAQSEPQNI